MRNSKLQRVLSVLLAVIMLAGTLSALPVSAEKPAKAPSTYVDTLFSADGYGFENFSGNVAHSEDVRAAIYKNSGIYYQNLANAEIRSYKVVDGKLVEDASGEDQKFYLRSGGGTAFFDAYAVGSGISHMYPQSRYLNDLLCSDVGYSKYTLEIDVAINGEFAGTYDANNTGNDYSPYRGISLLYLFSSGFTIKATGQGVGTGITYDGKKYAEDGTTDNYVEKSDGGYYNVTSVDLTGAKDDTGYLYLNSQSSNYIKLEETDANAALGSKSTAQANTTWDTTGAIDFNKIAAAGLTPVPYARGEEKTLKIDFVVEQVDGTNNDKYTATIYYGGMLVGTTTYTANAAAKKAGIKFMDVAVGVTLDNIKLTVDETSAFRSHPSISDYEHSWSKNYWDTQFVDTWRFTDFTNSYNDFSAKIYCPDCSEYDYIIADTAIKNAITDVVGNNSNVIYDSQGILKGTNDYFVVTNLNTEAAYVAPAEAKVLLNVGGTDVLKLGTDGKLALGNGTSFGDALVAKNSYTVAVRVMPSINEYQVYVDGVYAGAGDIAKSTTAITFSAFAGIRLLCNKATTVATDTTSNSSAVYSLKNASAKYCATHTEPADKTRTFHKTPEKSYPFSNAAGEATGAGNIILHDLAYSYICTECGQRTYVETGDSIVRLFRPNRCDSFNKYTVKASSSGDDMLYIDALPKTTDNTSPAFWLSFDYTTGSSLTKNDGNFFNIMDGFNSQLRYYYNSSTGAYFGNKNAGGEKIVSLEANTTYKFSIRIHPSKSMDVWVDEKLVYSSTNIANGQKNLIRLGMYGGGTLSNITAVQEAHTCTTDVTSIIQNRDALSYSFDCCGNTYNYNINKTLANNIKNVNGVETVSFTSASEYWIASDVNVKDASKDGALLTLGADKILELKDGKLASGTWTSAAITAPTTYSVAARISGKSYELYVEGQRVTSGTLSASGATALTYGDAGLGFNVRYNYNKIVTLGTKSAVVPTFVENDMGTVCYHFGTQKLYEDFSTKLVPEKEHGGNPASDTNVNLLYTTYICKGCGERVYEAEQGDNLYNVNPIYYDGSGNAKASIYNSNEASYNNKTLNAMSIRNGGFTRSGTANIYTNKDIIANPNSDYWFTFSFDMTEINTENPRKNSGEANFLNVMVDYTSLLRIYTVPNTVTANTPLSSFATSGKDFKITDAATCSTDFLLLRCKKTNQNLGLLYVGAHYDVAIHVVNGRADVYINDKLMVSGAGFLGTTSKDNADRPYSFRFFDQVSGKYQFRNLAFVKDAESYVDFNGMGVIEADVTHTATEGATTYTSALTASTTPLLAINDANGELVIPNGNGTYTSLYNSEGQKIVIGADATKVAVVNNNGKLSYYVNEKLARTEATVADEIAFAQDIEFNGNGFVEVSAADGVELTGNYGIGGTGTAEYIGFQKRVEAEIFKNQIRIVAGLNSLYYGNVGFKVTNKTTDKEISALGNDFNVYSSLLADAEKVYASDYGYNYFSLFEITDIDTSKDASYEISVIPYTTAGNNTVYGEEMILTIAIASGEISIS